MVQFWYPTLTARALPAKTPAASATTSSHAFLQELLRAPAQTDAPLASAKGGWPLLIFSPAWDGQRGQNTFLTEELASHGFIVAGIDHPYGSAATKFPDGRVVTSDPSLAMDLSSAEGLEQFLKNAEAQLQIRTQDVRFVLHEIERLNADDGWLSHQIDERRVGIFGHSFGGAVAAQACAADSRFKAGLDLDGVLFGSARTVQIRQPFLIMVGDTELPAVSPAEAANFAKLLEMAIRDLNAFHRRNGSYSVTVAGAEHDVFTDAPLFNPRRWHAPAGVLSPARGIYIANRYTLAFFEKTLNRKPSPLLDGNSPAFPEVKFEKFLPTQQTTRVMPVPQKSPH